MRSVPFQIDFPTDWIIDAAAWQWAAAIGMAAAIALGLYGWNSAIKRRSTGQGLPGWGRLAMGLLRFSALGIIGFLLLEPLIQSIDYDEEKPVAILLVDESASVLTRAEESSADSLNVWSRALAEDLTNRGMDVERYGFAGELRPIIDFDSAFQWDGAQTNLDEAIRTLGPRIENRNVAGIVLASDGLINRGASPIYGVQWPNLPVWTLGLGDTTAVQDRWINSVNHNAVAYLGNAFPVEVTAQARGAEGVPLALKLTSGNTTLATTTWAPQNELSSTQWTVQLDAEKAGPMPLSASIAPWKPGGKPRSLCATMPSAPRLKCWKAGVKL